MGYKKLDEVMELLHDELDGFNKALAKLRELTSNVENIKIMPDTSGIEHLLKEHLNAEEYKSSMIRRELENIEKELSKAKVTPKLQLWVQYTIWTFFLLIIGYLGFQGSRMDLHKERAFLRGKQTAISELKGYFDQYPEHYLTYRNWLKEKDSVPNRK